MSGPIASGAQPDWERVLSAAARLQALLPEAVLVGGTAAGLYARHRTSHDADHVLTDLRSRFDAVLGQLESVAGWKTARTNRPVLILGSLDGIETGVRQLVRAEPLETTARRVDQRRFPPRRRSCGSRASSSCGVTPRGTWTSLPSPTVSGRGDCRGLRALRRLYPQDSGESALQQMRPARESDALRSGRHEAVGIQQPRNPLARLEGNPRGCRPCLHGDLRPCVRPAGTGSDTSRARRRRRPGLRVAVRRQRRSRHVPEPGQPAAVS